MSDLSGEAFKAAEVVDHYTHRPPYAAQCYECILDNAPATGRLLDLGCGEGKIARPMTRWFDEVVAVDPAARMIALGKTLEKGRAPNIHWVDATAEAAPLSGRFDVVTFASSIHWMDARALFAHLRPHLNTEHMLAIVSGDEAYDPLWADDWQQFLAKWVPLATGRPLGAKEWQNLRDNHADHLTELRSYEFTSEPVQQSVEGYILCQHARNSFALSRLGDQLEAFRSDLAALLAPHADADGLLTYRVKTKLTLAKLDLSTEETE